MSSPYLTLTIGALSRRTGCKIETIRYYERAGLLPRPPRTDGGHRVFGRDHLKRLNFIRRSRELGFTLEQVRNLLSLVDENTFTCEEVKAMTVAHAGDVRRKIDGLLAMERVLTEMAAACDRGAVPNCPVVDALFEEQTPEGDSPHRWR